MERGGLVMDCNTCKNYEPRIQEPVAHPGRIFTEDLRVGMVIRRHTATIKRSLVVILDVPGETVVRSLQFRAGYEPLRCNMYLASSGLQPYKYSGKWAGAWCEEVT